MPYTPYDDLELGTVQGVKSKILSPEIAIQSTKGDVSNTDATIQSTLAITKANQLCRQLDLWLREVMPQTVLGWTQLRTNAFYRFHDRPNLDTIFPSGGTDAGWYEIGGMFAPVVPGIVVQKPATYYVTSPPDSTTLLNQAVNGDRLIDVNARKLYVNRGVDATPTVIWQRQNSADGKDYLINPEVLIDAHEYLTLSSMFELGIFKNRVNYQEHDSKTFMMDGQSYWYGQYVDELYGKRDEKGRVIVPGILKGGLLQTDFSNSGDFTDFDREMAGEEHYGIV